MPFTHTGGTTVRLLALSATIGLVPLFVIPDRAPEPRDSAVAAGSVDGRFSAAPVALEPLGDRVAPDRPSHLTLLAVIGAVCIATTRCVGFLVGVLDDDRIVGSHASSRWDRAPPAAVS